VLTADRPPELLDTGAGQTIDQVKLYGAAVRWAATLGPADDLSHAVFGPIGRRAAAIATGPIPGPVHLDVMLREPLVPETPAQPSRIPGVVRETPVVADATVDALLARVRDVERGMLVAGWGSGATGGVIDALARGLGWPLLADPIGNARVGPHAISTYEALVRVDDFAERMRPEVVLRFGAPLTSKVTESWLAGVAEQIAVADHDGWLDPHRATSVHVRADAQQLAARLVLATAGGGFRTPNAPPSPWLAAWRDAERRVRAAIDAALDRETTVFDGRVARDVAAGLPDGVQMLVASSMPVRDLEWFAAPRAGIVVHANRGVNGIDGMVSTAAGIAIGSGAPTVALLGDLALLHDTNGLIGLAGLNGRAGLPIALTFVVVDNDGGGIFSFLPQVEALDSAEFEALFGTPHGLDLTALLASYRIPVEVVADPGRVAAAVGDAIAGGGVRAVVVRTDRSANVERHRALWAAAAAALR
jgi:2-succinyl-5-enolpyruvyl-6-hydroxy-3-cyclohexene-1-carboxylate synthase